MNARILPWTSDFRGCHFIAGHGMLFEWYLFFCVISWQSMMSCDHTMNENMVIKDSIVCILLHFHLILMTFWSVPNNGNIWIECIPLSKLYFRCFTHYELYVVCYNTSYTHSYETIVWCVSTKVVYHIWCLNHTCFPPLCTYLFIKQKPTCNACINLFMSWLRIRTAKNVTRYEKGAI